MTLGGLQVVLLAALATGAGDTALWREARKRRARERCQAAEREQSLRCADEADGRTPIREMAKTEWGVANERGGITACESERAARQLHAASGGELVYRRTWITTWS
jgi:hypothetical protein